MRGATLTALCALLCASAAVLGQDSTTDIAATSADFATSAALATTAVAKAATSDSTATSADAGGTSADAASTSSHIPDDGTTSALPYSTTEFHYWNATTSAPPSPSGCEANTDCTSCTSSNDCVWCKGESKCVGGDFRGSSVCSDWQWRQCDVQGTIALYLVIAAICVVVVIFFIICICCCCCCCKKKKKSKGYTARRKDAEDEREQLLPHESAHPKTDQRRAELMAKYGIRPKAGNNDADQFA
jgi:hypothetical protein